MSNILERVNSPSDLKILSESDLAQLATEIREQMVKVISRNGGHLASSLGTVELTIALHRVFESPHDKIIWDVGHQSYAHKMLTGRREKFNSIRQYGGISGFPVRAENPHDAFGAGHSGTSISAALGIAMARDMNNEDYQVIAVIGDGSLTSGMAFEAINHAGHMGTRMIVVLNDNGMSIGPSIGALSRLLSQVKIDARYNRAKKKMKGIFAHLPFGKRAWSWSRRVKTTVESVVLPSAYWEEMGFRYLGPFDGHNITAMETALTRAQEPDSRPVLVHVLTQKGKGYPEAENDVVRYHGISPTGTPRPEAPQYSQVFGQTISRLMKENDKVVVISAAMLDGTGLAKTAAEFPKRVFDVGIGEQHAVTLAAGLASQGYIPIVAIYSTFLQRAYDQIVHDVCLQNLPVILAVDRAGIVGEDGKTHQGSFDISYLRSIPNMTIASPRDEDELQHLLYSAVCYKQPIAIRYPRGSGEGVPLMPELHELPIGKGEVVLEGKDLAIMAIGPSVGAAVEAAEELSKQGIDCAVVNARFAKPLDYALILSLAHSTRNILTVEENTLCGGFGSAVMELLSSTGLSNYKIRCLGLPDKFIEHGPQELFRSLYNIDSEGIAQYIRTYFPELFPQSSLRMQEGK
jgi:1-deoxy-D-xylulose-5-phosphate synthase